MTSTSNGGGPGDGRPRLPLTIADPNREGGPDTLARIELPPTRGSLSHSMGSGQTMRMDGTNVVRVPFGVRKPRRQRPQRPDHWATVVLPFHLGGGQPPPQAA